MNEAYLIDCMEYMKTLPDKAFDLAVVDPPYGDALHAEDGLYAAEHRNLRGRFDRYNNTDTRSQSVQVERERERSGITASETPEAYSSDTSVTRTGGTWAAKHGKKS